MYNEVEDVVATNFLPIIQYLVVLISCALCRWSFAYLLEIAYACMNLIFCL